MSVELTTGAVTWLLYVNGAPIWVWLPYLILQVSWLAVRAVKEGSK